MFVIFLWNFCEFTIRLTNCFTSIVTCPNIYMRCTLHQDPTSLLLLRPQWLLVRINTDLSGEYAVSNSDRDTEKGKSQRNPWEKKNKKTGRQRMRTRQRKTVWEEVKVRTTLHWICGGAKLPSGATWPAYTAKARGLGLISTHTSSSAGKGTVAWLWVLLSERDG